MMDYQDSKIISDSTGIYSYSWVKTDPGFAYNSQEHCLFLLPHPSLLGMNHILGRPQNQLSFWDQVSGILCSGSRLADAYQALVPHPWPNAGPECTPKMSLVGSLPGPLLEGEG